MLISRILFIYFSFEGRISRRTYWVVSISLVVASFLVVVVGRLIDEVIGTPPIEGGISYFIGRWPIELGLSLAMIYPGFAVLVKRLHDRNKGAKWLALQLIPIVGSIWLLVEAGFLRGTVGTNEWGDDPLARDRPATDAGSGTVA